jgi:virginiamycin B lyase
VPNENGTVARVDPVTSSVVAKIPVAPDPDYAAFCGGRLWVTSLYGRSVSIIDPATNGVVARVPLGVGTQGIACGRSIWISNYDTGVLLRVNPASRTVTGRIRTGVQPRAVALGAGSVWVANGGSGTVARVAGR